VFKVLQPVASQPKPPQTTITLLVHTAVAPSRAAGASVLDIDDQPFATGSKRPPLLTSPIGSE
jgi:hypothetical protein